MTNRTFVYGTLKRGGTLHHHLQTQTFVGLARTARPGRLYKLGWYPGLVEDSSGQAIEGEVWDVDDATLTILDDVEGVADGLYERQSVPLLPPFDTDDVVTYFYLGDVAGLSDCGTCWPVDAL